MDLSPLLDEIAADVDDDAPRWVMADRALAARHPFGEFVARQLDRANRHTDGLRGARAGRQERALLAEHGKAFFGGVYQSFGSYDLRLGGGLPEMLHINRARTTATLPLLDDGNALVPDSLRFVRHVVCSDGDDVAQAHLELFTRRAWPNLHAITGVFTHEVHALTRCLGLRRIGISCGSYSPDVHEFVPDLADMPALERVDIDLGRTWLLRLEAVPVAHLGLRWTAREPERACDRVRAWLPELHPEVRTLDLFARGLRGLRLRRTERGTWQADLQPASWISSHVRHAMPWHWPVDLDLLAELLAEGLVETTRNPIRAPWPEGYAVGTPQALEMLRTLPTAPIVWSGTSEPPWAELPEVPEVRVRELSKAALVAALARPELGDLSVFDWRGRADRLRRGQWGTFVELEATGDLPPTWLEPLGLMRVVGIGGWMRGREPLSALAQWCADRGVAFTLDPDASAA